MSSESEKQFFIQKHLSQKQGEKSPEKPQVPSKVSPEKREEAIQYTEEIRRIREKEILTEEDLVKVKDLAEKLKRIYSPEIQFESEKAKERLVELKQTLLWDEEKGQWKRTMYENQRLQSSSSNRLSEDQLLGVIAEAITGNPEEAKERLEKLKKTPLWDKERKQWNWWSDENQKLQDPNRFSESQLLGVIAEAITGNLEGAKERLEKLKKTPLWDEKREQWNDYMDENQELRESARLSHNQLLGVLAEAITGNLEGAKEGLKELKKTPLWDEKREQWNWSMDENQILRNSDCSSGIQLFGVLVEAVTGNLEGAKERLEKLKETPLWDEERKQWKNSMDKNQELRNSIRFSYNQLLGVLAEAFHEKGKKFVEWLIKKK